MDIQFLIKFGKKEHLDQLLNLGHIYIKPTSYFKQNINHGRFDKTEGRLKLLNVKNSYLEVRPKGESEWKKLDMKSGKIEYWHNVSEFFIYSLFHISEQETREIEYYKLPAEIRELGEFYLFIKDPKAFMNRMVKTLDRINLECAHGLIEYYDENKNYDRLTLFHKPEAYKYQKEFRIVVNSKSQDPLEFDIGSLRDIAEICHIDQYAGFQFKW